MPTMTDDYDDYEYGDNRRDTQWEVWHKIQGCLKGWQRDVFAQLVEHAGHKGVTCDRLEELHGWKHQTISATINALFKKGYAVDSGNREDTRGGNAAICWVPGDGTVPCRTKTSGERIDELENQIKEANKTLAAAARVMRAWLSGTEDEAKLRAYTERLVGFIES